MKWLVILLLLSACHRDEAIPNQCGVDNPLTDLPWLKGLAIDNGLGSSIVQGTYQGQTVYAVSTCFRCFAGASVSIYRCNGAIICSGLALDTSASGCSKIARNLDDKRTLVEY